MRSLPIILVFLFTGVSSQKPVVWIKKFGENNYIVLEGMALDKKGALLLAGTCLDTDSLDFDTIQIPGGRPNRINPFIAKLDSAGKPLWVQRPFDAAGGKVHAVATDSKDNVYLGSLFNTELITADTLVKRPHAFFSYAFLQKFTPEGSLQWTRILGLIKPGSHMTVNVTSADDLVVSAFLDDCSLLGLPEAKEYHLFKFDKNAGLIWARAFDRKMVSVSQVRIGVHDNIHIAGRFHDPTPVCYFSAALTTFSTTGETLTNTIYPCDEIKDFYADRTTGNLFVAGATSKIGTWKRGFISLYTSGGRLLWMKTFAGKRDCIGMRLAVAGDYILMATAASDLTVDDTYIPDRYADEITIDPSQMILLKMTKQGKLVWWNAERGYPDVPELATADERTVFAAGNLDNVFNSQTNYASGRLFVAKFR